MDLFLRLAAGWFRDYLECRSLSRVTPQRLAREFKGGLTVVGLARKYALRRQQVEDWIRSVARGSKC